MSTATAPRKSTKSSANGSRKAEVVARVKDLPLIGELVTWKPVPAGKADIVNALKAAGLDADAVRDLSCTGAFGRAAKQMEEDKLIHLVRQDADEAVYQLTKKTLKATHDDDREEYEFSKQTYVRLHKNTGKVVSKSKTVQEWFQAELDKALAHRTASDVTFVVQRLFETAKIDLIRWRDQGGAYLVFAQHAAFTDRVEEFLTTLGGRMDRLPIPKGHERAERSVANVVTEAISDLISDHTNAIEGLDVHSRKDTIEKAAARIRETKVKIEAYAQYLRGRGDDLEQELTKCQQALAAKVQQIAEQRAALPPEAKTTKQRLLEALTDTPKTIEELMAEVGSTNTQYGYMGEFVKAGLAIKTPDGYTAAPK